MLFPTGKILELLGAAATHWKEIAVVLMVITIFHQNFMTTEWLKWVGVRTLPGMQQEHTTEISAIKEQLTECEGSRESLKTAIDSVNQQVDRWANVSKQLQLQHDTLVIELRLSLIHI